MSQADRHDPDCVFCRIARGDLPCALVYENEHLLAFMDIAPLADGHLLIVPKHHVDWVSRCDAETMAAIGAVLPRLAAAVVEATGAAGFNILNNNGKLAGQAVPHLHFHIIPRAAGDPLGYRWPAMADYPREKLSSFRDRIAAALDLP
jgi:histidine triad (HIT) family protein